MLVPRSTISESCFTSPARTASCILSKCTFFLAPDELAVSLDAAEGPELASAGMLQLLGLGGGVESRPRLLRRSSLALPQDAGRSQSAPLREPSSSLRLSQEPVRRRPASSLPVPQEESLAA